MKSSGSTVSCLAPAFAEIMSLIKVNDISESGVASGRVVDMVGMHSYVEYKIGSGYRHAVAKRC